MALDGTIYPITSQYTAGTSSRLSLDFYVGGGVFTSVTWSLTTGSGSLTPIDSPVVGQSVRLAAGFTAAGSYAFTLRAVLTNPSGTANVERSFTVVVTKPVLSFDTTSLPAGQEATAYEVSLAASGGVPFAIQDYYATPYYQWSAVGLPPGLTITTQTGQIVGTPTQKGAYTPTITVKDATGTTGSKTFALTITRRSLQLRDGGPLAATVGVAYSRVLPVDFGVAPFTGAMTGTPKVPNGLSFTFSTLTLAGTPTETGTFTLNFDLASSDGNTGTDTIPIVISTAAALEIVSGTLGTWVKGAAHSGTMVAQHGTPPYTWTATNLPDGLTIGSSTGIVSGTATTVGEFTALVTVTDAVAATDTWLAYIRVIAPLTLYIEPHAPPDGQVGIAYSTTFAASGGLPSFFWSWETDPPGATPDFGLTINGYTGMVSGTPTAIGTFATRIHVTDSVGTVATLAATFTIVAAVGGGGGGGGGDGVVCGVVEPAGVYTVLLGDRALNTIVAITTSNGGDGSYSFSGLDPARSYFVVPLASGGTLQKITGLDYVTALT